MVAPRTLAILSGLLAALLLSGCTVSNGPGGQSARADGSLAYNGNDTGTDSDEFACDGSGSIHITANLGSGKLSSASATPAVRRSTRRPSRAPARRAAAHRCPAPRARGP